MMIRMLAGTALSILRFFPAYCHSEHPTCKGFQLINLLSYCTIGNVMSRIDLGDILRDPYEKSGASPRSLSVIIAVREIASRLKPPLIGEQC